MPQHLAFPFRVTATGSLATVEQDSDADLVQSVALLLDTRPGERRSVPDYGLPDPVFGGLDVSEVADVVLEWEERADQLDVDQIAQGVVDHAQVFPYATSNEAGSDDTDATDVTEEV